MITAFRCIKVPDAETDASINYCAFVPYSMPMLFIVSLVLFCFEKFRGKP